MNYGAKVFQELDMPERFIQDMQMSIFILLYKIILI